MASSSSFDLNESPPLSPTRTESPPLSPIEEWLGLDDISEDESPPLLPTRTESPPLSPIDEWLGLDDISEDETIFFQNTNDEHVEEPIQQQASQVPNLNSRPRYELKKWERFEAMQFLLAKSVNGKVASRYKLEVAIKYGTCLRTIQRLWRLGKKTNFKEYDCKRVSNCGRKPAQVDDAALSALPVNERTTIRQTAFAIGMAKTTLHRKFKLGALRRHSSAAKPDLTPHNLTTRMQHCLTSLEYNSLPHSPVFQTMHNTTHIDEKWFYLSQGNDSCYLGHQELDPVRNIKSAQLSSKIMFLAAVARPRYDCEGNCTFDGKIGIFPFVKLVAAARNSRYRPRGTLETKCIPNINRKVICHFLLGKILSAIAEKWPIGSLMDPIFIQQDNAPSHLLIHDEEFCDAVSDSGLNVSLVCQPPNSPYLNVLDLGFFRAIESLQRKKRTTTVYQLIAVVQEAFEAFDHTKCNNVFLTLQACMVEILKLDGGNNYRIPHMGKDKLRRNRQLPTVLSCPPEVYANAVIQQAL